MSRIAYNKLVRDRIPEIIAEQGRAFAVETMSEADFAQALREKLVEEAQEARDADLDHLLLELADLQEVVDQLIKFYGLSRDLLQEEQHKRRQERGGFEKKMMLLWTD